MSNLNLVLKPVELSPTTQSLFDSIVHKNLESHSNDEKLQLLPYLTWLNNKKIFYKGSFKLKSYF